jgi:hypothetical protein
VSQSSHRRQGSEAKYTSTGHQVEKSAGGVAGGTDGGAGAACQAGEGDDGDLPTGLGGTKPSPARHVSWAQTLRGHQGLMKS